MIYVINFTNQNQVYAIITKNFIIKIIFYNKDKQFSCDKCNKKFTRKQNLTIHLNNSCKGVVTNQEIVPNIKKQELANTINNNNINTNNGPINNGTVNNTYIYKQNWFRKLVRFIKTRY